MTTTKNIMYTLVSTFSKTFDELGLIYFVPSFLEAELKVGMIVEIPLKDKIEIAVVLKIGTEESLGIGINPEKIKSLISIKNETIFLNNYQLILLPWIADYYFTPIHNSASLFFPKNLREKIVKDKFKIPSCHSELDSESLKKSNSNQKKDPEINSGGQTKFTYTFNHNKSLSISQQKAHNHIINSKNNKILIHGVTGSGKTEIYIKLIKDNLNKGKQSLLLIPEIILTNQLATRLKDVFGEDIIVLNSSVSEAKKTQYWTDIHTNNAKIIIGTRSALFYPYNNLGLIIIDEEHDNSYISDSSPRYKGVEVAEKITEINGNKLVLGSGTPSINIMYESLKGKYELVSLLEKFDK